MDLQFGMEVVVEVPSKILTQSSQNFKKDIWVFLNTQTTQWYTFQPPRYH